MKIYCFYLYDKDMTKDQYISLKSIGWKQKDMNRLYAFTTRKKYAKLFMKTRNMNKFILMKHDVDKEIYIEFANKKRGSVLEIYNYIYYPDIENNIDKTKEAKILSTYMERTFVDAQVDQSLMGFSESINFTDPFRLQEKWKDNLNILEYINLYKIYIANSFSSDNFSLHPFIPEDEDYPYEPMIILDELQVFIRNFGKYFK